MAGGGCGRTALNDQQSSRCAYGWMRDQIEDVLCLKTFLF